jgi:hypothetical protein
MKRVYYYFYTILPIRKVITDRKIIFLSDQEIKTIKNRERLAITLAALLGAIGVVLLYSPYYFFTNYFPNTPITVFNNTFQIPFVFLGYSIVLVAIEIILLTLLNIWCTHEIAVATGFINHENKHADEKKDLLVNIGLEKKNKQSLTYGIDPFQGINKRTLLAWNLMIMLKATLSNMLFKFIIQRVLGRYAIKSLKSIQDFAGIPIFAAWNAFGTKKILTQARVIIMGENVVADLVIRIKKDHKTSSEFKNLLYETLRYIAISKRDFHQNHYLLTKHLFELYNIEPNKEKSKKKEYLQLLFNAPKKEKEICKLLISIGFILDGRLSTREKIRIQEMKKKEIFDLTLKEMNQYQKDFINGKGVESLIQKYI